MSSPEQNDEIMSIDGMKVFPGKNREYYKTAEPCDCDVCRFFCRNVRSRLPDIAAYLDSIGVDIEKPFELLWIEIDESGTLIHFDGCQYIVFGSCEPDFEMNIGDIKFINNIDFHPSTDIADEHFVLDFGEITMKMEE